MDFLGAHSDQLIVLFLFVTVFVGIVLEKFDKTLIAIAGALIVIFLGFISFNQAIEAIDFATIGLLLGMMLLVECLREIRIFEWLSLKLGLLTKGNPILIFIVFSVSTAVASAFLDNVTTVLIMVPLVISITTQIGLRPRIFIFALIFMSNIGGTATLIGDPPNILIGSQVPGLTFGSFLQYLSVPVIITIILTMFYMIWRHKEEVQSRATNFSWLFMSSLMLQQIRREYNALVISNSTLYKASIVFIVVLIGFFTHSITHIEPAMIALAGAALMLLVFNKQIDLHHLIAKVEWPTLLFFSGLFMLVGAMEHVGLLTTISGLLVSMTDNLLVLIIIVLWSSAILSALVDNIPFVAVMIPVLKQLQMSEPFISDPKAHLLWWALSLGACFGGNGSMIGASANVVSCAIARTRGIDITFKEFISESFVITVISIVVASLYLTALYYY